MEPRPVPRSDQTSPTAGTDLEHGDDRALAADWPQAVADWEKALGTSDSDRARARLSWLADQGTTTDEVPAERWWTGPIAIGFLAVVVATGLVLVAEHQSQRVSDVLAVVAWVLYVFGAGCGLLYAYQHRPRRQAENDAILVERARQVAIAAGGGSGTIGAGSGPVS